MEPAVAAALIALAGSIFVTAANVVWTSRQNKANREEASRLAREQRAGSEALETLKKRLSVEAKEDEWHLEQRKAFAEELRRYRLPLLDAANDLGHRINNIRNDSFLEYLTAGSGRRDVALQSTAFRLAKYFGVLEVIYERVGFLPFEREEESKNVVGILAHIGRTFATDKWDRDGRPWYLARFMIWREEQRAIGEVARQASSDRGSDTFVGFATFAESWDRQASPWFARFIYDLESENADKSERLRRLQVLLSKLVRRLDNEGRFEGPKDVPPWIQLAEIDPLWRLADEMIANGEPDPTMT
jgi:hypothetical protein